MKLFWCCGPLERDLSFWAEVGAGGGFNVGLAFGSFSFALPGLTPLETKLLLVLAFLSNFSKKVHRSLATAGLWSFAIVLKTSKPSF